MAQKLNLIIVGGATFRRMVTWKDSNRQRVSLRGYAARMEIRNKVLPIGYLLQQMTTGNGCILLEQETDSEASSVGVISLVLTPQLTQNLATLTFPKYTAVYDLVMIAPNSDLIPLLTGVVTIQPTAVKI